MGFNVAYRTHYWQSQLPKPDAEGGKTTTRRRSKETKRRAMEPVLSRLTNERPTPRPKYGPIVVKIVLLDAVGGTRLEPKVTATNCYARGR
jgi:hypothetical protein